MVGGVGSTCMYSTKRHHPPICAARTQPGHHDRLCVDPDGRPGLHDHHTAGRGGAAAGRLASTFSIDRARNGGRPGIYLICCQRLSAARLLLNGGLLPQRGVSTCDRAHAARQAADAHLVVCWKTHKPTSSLPPAWPHQTLGPQAVLVQGAAIVYQFVLTKAADAQHMRRYSVFLALPSATLRAMSVRVMAVSRQHEALNRESVEAGEAASMHVCSAPCTCSVVPSTLHGHMPLVKGCHSQEPALKQAIPWLRRALGGR